jgi:hypothetical protein
MLPCAIAHQAGTTIVDVAVASARIHLVAKALRMTYTYRADAVLVHGEP